MFSATCRLCCGAAGTDDSSRRARMASSGGAAARRLQLLVLLLGAAEKQQMEPEELRRLLRGVVSLQASVKGHLVRKRFQSLKEEYESIVKDTEGTLDLLQWNTGGSIPRPIFPPKSASKPMKVKAFSTLQAGSSETHMPKKEETLSCPLELQSEAERNGEKQLPSRLEATDAVRQNLDHMAEQPPGGAWPLSEESEEGKACSCRSSLSSAWSSAVLQVASPGLSQDLHFQREKEMPQTVPELQCYRKHLTMELLWLQQAIASRKNYLILKQRLGNPE